MARKPMTPAETLVGRRLPPDPTYFEQIMSGFTKQDGSFCGKFEPSDGWLRPAHRKARKEGLIKLGIRIGFGKGPAAGLYYLTPKGEEVATAARAICVEKRAAREVWGKDFKSAVLAKRAAKAAEQPDTEPQEEGPSP
jgi:DNA-binding PadR family transcriptional regulator